MNYHQLRQSGLAVTEISSGNWITPDSQVEKAATIRKQTDEVVSPGVLANLAVGREPGFFHHESTACLDKLSVTSVSSVVNLFETEVTRTQDRSRLRDACTSPAEIFEEASPSPKN